MLAANGSIFTILAISFERYYAICQPLKAGYKCTRLRAIVIICAIWLLTSILTSPILIMAKSAQTVYIDGSLVENCILETDTYWLRLYVYASMFAFFCLPLIVLILVYWLISRRLIRENIIMSTTTSLATNDSIENSQTSNSFHIHPQCNHSAHSTTGAKMARLTKAASLKSISAFFSSLHHHHHLHHSSHHNQYMPSSKTSGITHAPDDGAQNYENELKMDGDTALPQNHKRHILTTSKALSLDNHLMINSSNTIESLEGKAIGLNNRHHECQGPLTGRRITGSSKKSFANKLVYQLFHLDSINSDGKGTLHIESDQSEESPAKDCRFIMNSSESGCQATDSTRCNEDIDQTSQEPFLHMSPMKEQQKFNDAENRFSKLSKSKIGRQNRRSKIRWVKRFSISSTSASAQTNCTTLLSETTANCQEGLKNGLNSRPRSIIRRDGSSGSYSPIKKNHLARGGRRTTHFNVNPDQSSNTLQCSIASETTSPYSSSKSPSPDSMIINEEKIAFILENHNESVSDDIEGLASFNSGLSPLCKPLSLTGDFSQNIESTDVFESKTSGLGSSKGSPCINYCDRETLDHTNLDEKGNRVNIVIEGDNSENLKVKLASVKGRSLDNHHYQFPINLKRTRNSRRHKASVCSCNQIQSKGRLSELLVVQDLSKKQQMDSRRQVVIMLAFVVACFFLLFLPYRVFTIWLILSTDDQVQSLGMETYYNLTYFSRILIYLHSAINPIAYNLISTKFRRAFMSILLCRGSSSRRHFTTEHRIINNNNKALINDNNLRRSKQSRESHK